MIKITADPSVGFPVELVNKNYQMKPPKAAIALGYAASFNNADTEDVTVIQKAIADYIDMSFSKIDSKAIQKRLNDTDDLLDIGHIMQLIEAVTEMQTGNPTS